MNEQKGERAKTARVKLVSNDSKLATITENVQNGGQVHYGLWGFTAI